MTSIDNNGQIEFYRTGSVTYSQAISGSGSVLQAGSGTTILAGTNTYSGSTSVMAGTLILASTGSLTGGAPVTVSSGAVLDANGSISGTVNNNGTLRGSGSVGVISGTGLVGPGNSPGILTAESVNPAGGQSYAFQFSQTGAPNYSQVNASGNDVLDLTAASPFSQALSSSNVINVYFMAGLSSGQIYDGGFYTDQGNFLAYFQNATFAYYLEDPTGSYSYDGNNYDLYSGSLTFAVGSVQQTADFAGGTENGYAMTVTVSGVPEPPAWALLAVSGAGLAWFSRARRYFQKHRKSGKIRPA